MKQPIKPRQRQTAIVAPTKQVVPPTPAEPPPSASETAAPSLLEKAAQDVLAITYWFEPLPHPHPYPVTIKFTGHRVGVAGPPQAGDQFTHYEALDTVVPGSGPIAVTAKIPVVQPGTWQVTATAQALRRVNGRQTREMTLPTVAGLSPLLRFWRWWSPLAGTPQVAAYPVKTGLAPFVRIPGVLLGGWFAFVMVGAVVAVLMQRLVIARDQLALPGLGRVMAVAIVAGILGAKGWFVIKHWHARRWQGWCIQGFVVAGIGVAMLLLAVNHVAIGVFLDATAPGLLLGMAIGRVGCFFGGCCGGPPTAARWGIWSSDQRIGARRVPTQLLEATFTALIGLGALIAVLRHGPLGGTFFVAAFALYLLGRHGILQLRAEPQPANLRTPLVPALAGAVLLAAFIIIGVHMRVVG